MSKSGAGIFIKILKILASIFLSFVFIVTSFSMPILHSAASLFTPKTVTTVIQNIDFAQMIENSEEFNSAIADLGLDKDAITAMIQSKEIGDFLQSCIGTVMDVVIGDPENIHTYDPAVLNDVIDNHIDEITKVLQENIDKPLTKEEIHSTMKNLVKNNSSEIKRMFADLTSDETFMAPYKSIVSLVQTASSWVFVLVIILFEALILGLIYILNKNKFGGFIWITVNSLIAAISLTAVLVVLKSGLITGMFYDTTGIITTITSTVFGTITTKLLITIIILAVVAVAAIAAFIPLKIHAFKKATALAAIENLPLEPEAADTEHPIEETQE